MPLQRRLSGVGCQTIEPVDPSIVPVELCGLPAIVRVGAPTAPVEWCRLPTIVPVDPPRVPVELCGLPAIVPVDPSVVPVELCRLPAVVLVDPSIVPVALYSACEIAWHGWEQPVVEECGVVLVYTAGTCRRYSGAICCIVAFGGWYSMVRRCDISIFDILVL